MVSRATQIQMTLQEHCEAAPELSQPRWYAAYTCANHEKKVSAQFQRRHVEHYLPEYDSVRRWKDRKVHLKMPLFPGYVFVRVPLEKRLRVLEVPGVAHLVGFSGRPSALEDEEIETLRSCLQRRVLLKPHPYIQAGRRVRVRSGPLQGLSGLVVRKKNGVRFVVSFDLIARSASAELDSMDLELLD